jgi:uncharacterized protein YcfL
MKKTCLALIPFVCILFGCTSEGPYVPAERQPSLEVENTAVLMDQELSDIVAVDLQKAERSTKGKLKAFANVRNRTNNDITLQVQTVFRDAAGFSIDDDTAWETIILTANETRTITTTSTSSKAEKYTVRIRMMR